MIVEDEQDLLDLYKDYLRNKGYHVIVSSTIADEVLIDFKKYWPDLILIDYKLPGEKNGLQAARDILLLYPSAKVIIITAFDNVRSEVRSDKFYDDKHIKVLIKPIRLSHLADLIVA
jgi:DNA-binding response OmpR family regulator